MAIIYNLLNLQQSLSQNGTTVASYTWLADGTKCAVVDNTTSGYDYLGSLIYIRSGSVRTLESAAFGGGRFVNTNNTILPYYYITDHLGSTRVITDNSGNVVERNDYYPFGGKHANPSYAQLTVNKQKFSGKELQTTGNTGFLDYGARMYDDVTGRWGVVDPMAEDFPSLTPYHYVHSNPIIMTDPTGMAASPIYDEEGKFLGTDNQGLKGDAIIMNKDNFKQGMSHEEAKKNDLGTDGLKSIEAKSNQLDHYQTLKNRPDYDGFVTISEVVDWAKKNPGALKNPTPDNTLYLDAAKLDFGNISTSNFQNINETTPVNLLNSGNLASSTFNSRLRASVYALGRVDMQLKNRSLGTVSIVNNRATDYDWNTGGGQLRSTLINAERLRTGIGDNHGFRTYYYGYGKLNK